MIERAIILEIREDCALAMKKDSEVVRIRRREDMIVGKEMFLLPEDYLKEPEKSLLHSWNRRGKQLLVAGIAACLLLLVMLTLPTGKVYAEVTLEAEKGYHIRLDQNHRVLQIHSLGFGSSEEALTNWKGKTLLQLEDLLQAELGEGMVLIGYVLEEGEKDDLREELEELFRSRKLVIFKANRADLEKADREGIGLGAYLIHQRWEDLEWDELSDQQLMELLRQDPSLLEEEEFREALEGDEKEENDEEDEGKDEKEEEDGDENED